MPTADDMFIYLKEKGWVCLEDGKAANVPKKMWGHPHTPANKYTFLQAFFLQKKLDTGRRYPTVCVECGAHWFNGIRRKKELCDNCYFVARTKAKKIHKLCRLQITVPEEIEAKVKRVADIRGESMLTFLQAIILKELANYE